MKEFRFFVQDDGVNIGGSREKEMDKTYPAFYDATHFTKRREK